VSKKKIRMAISGASKPEIEASFRKTADERGHKVVGKNQRPDVLFLMFSGVTVPKAAIKANKDGGHVVLLSRTGIDNREQLKLFRDGFFCLPCPGTWQASSWKGVFDAIESSWWFKGAV